MRILESKYAGVCSACGTPYAIGERIAYEKMTGCFHSACEPKDPEAIRKYQGEIILHEIKNRSLNE